MFLSKATAGHRTPFRALSKGPTKILIANVVRFTTAYCTTDGRMTIVSYENVCVWHALCPPKGVVRLYEEAPIRH